MPVTIGRHSTHRASQRPIGFADEEKLDENAEIGWVIDGSYFSKLRTLVSDNATDIICKFVEYERTLSLSGSSGF